MRRRIIFPAALFAVMLAPSMAFAQSQGEAKAQATNIREFTSTAITTTIISTLRQGFSRSIRKAFGFNFFGTGSLPPSAGDRRELGMSAGEEDGDTSTWVNAGYRNYHSDAGGVSTKSNIYAGLVGMDVVASERYIVGVSTGYTTSRSRSNFTAVGPTAFESGSTLDNWTIASYGAALLTDNVFVDVTAGLILAQSRVNTRSGALITTSGDQDTRTKFVSVNVNYAKVFDRVNVSGTVGYNYSKNRAESFVSDQGLDLPGSVRANSFMTFGGEVGYQYKEYAPYALAALEIDLARNPRGGGDFLVGAPVAETDKVGMRLGVGLDFEYSDNIIGSFELSKVVGKEGVVDTSGFLNLHITF